MLGTPIFIFEGNLTLYKDDAKSFDLSQFFMDPENDSLTFLSTEPDNLISFVDYQQLILTPDEGFVGKSSIKIYASDGITTVTSPEILIYVIEKPVVVPELIQLLKSKLNQTKRAPTLLEDALIDLASITKKEINV